MRHILPFEIRRKPKPVTYSCYWVAVHFASAEDAARFINEKLLPDRIGGRMLRGGETLPLCRP